MGVNAWAVVLHWYSGVAGPWTLPQVQALNTSVDTNWKAQIMPLLSATVRYIQCVSTDLSDTTNRTAESAVQNVPGQIAGVPPTLASCFLISHTISSRFRGGHPRTYLPPSSTTSTSDGDNWSSGTVSGIQTNWQNFIAAVTTSVSGAGLTLNSFCAPRYTWKYDADNVKHKFIKTKQAFLGPFPISDSIVQQGIATQRRRLGPA
jgi:hypothetical protein